MYSNVGGFDMALKPEVISYRIKNNLCVNCGNKARDGYKTCEECASNARQKAKKHREKHKSNGLCVDCSDQSIDDSQYCQKHKDAQHVSQRKRDRAWRLQKTNDGLCSDCGKNKPLPEKKLCEQCRNAYADRLERWRTKKLADGLCSRCGKDKIIPGLKQCKNCSLERLKLDKSIKLQILNAYGNECACCGENEIDFLALDHINNDGHKDRRRGNSGGGISFYRKVIKNGFPSNLQILCHNCNWSKHVNNGRCIHQIKKDKYENVSSQKYNINKEDEGPSPV